MLINIVREKINKTHVQAIKTNINPQIESASSSISPSVIQPKALQIAPSKPKESLYNKIWIIIGTIKSEIAIIAIMPQVFFIIERLEATAFKESLIEAPTMGTKLLIAKRAVFIVIESLPCASTFFADKIKKSIDITNTITEVNVVLIVLEIPFKLQPLIGLTIEIVKQALTSGNRHTTKKLSVREIAITEVEQLIAVEDIAPVIIPIALIKGRKAFITLHNVFM